MRISTCSMCGSPGVSRVTCPLNLKSTHTKPRKHYQAARADHAGATLQVGGAKEHVLIACHPRKYSKPSEHRYGKFISHLISDASGPASKIVETTDITGNPDHVMDLFNPSKHPTSLAKKYQWIFMLDCEFAHDDWWTDEGIARVTQDINNVYGSLAATDGSLALGKFTAMYDGAGMLDLFYGALKTRGFHISVVHPDTPGYTEVEAQGPIWLLTK